MSKTAREVMIEADGYMPGGQNLGEVCADILLQRLAAAGFVIVPKEPTEQMCEAGSVAIQNCYSPEPGEGLDEDPAGPCYSAMIAAAQEPKP